jgi:hypothetical protein
MVAHDDMLHINFSEQGLKPKALRYHVLALILEDDIWAFVYIAVTTKPPQRGGNTIAFLHRTFSNTFLHRELH